MGFILFTKSEVIQVPSKKMPCISLPATWKASYVFILCVCRHLMVKAHYKTQSHNFPTTTYLHVQCSWIFFCSLHDLHILITPHSHFYSVIHAATPFIIMTEQREREKKLMLLCTAHGWTFGVKYLWLFTTIIIIIIFHLSHSPFIPNWLTMEWFTRGNEEMEVRFTTSRVEWMRGNILRGRFFSSFYIYRNINTYRVWYYSYYLLLSCSTFSLSLSHSRCVPSLIIV